MYSNYDRKKRAKFSFEVAKATERIDEQISLTEFGEVVVHGVIASAR